METLANWINRRGPLAPRDAVGWTIRLAKHLESMHTHGVAHGAVSPACALIEDHAPTSRGVVADVRRTLEMVQYHSPERLANGQLSPLDDVWGLAGTLFSLLTCARPFGELRPEIEQRLRQSLPHLATFGVADDQLYAIVATALYPDPSRRTGNVTTLRMQLEHWAQDPAFRALPPLDTEDSGEEDQAATAMVPMDRNLFEEPSTNSAGARPPMSGPTSSQLFAPPSFDPSSQPKSSAARPPPVAASPLGEQDATVMRELPAHIIAMAQRAVSGSNPPGPPPPDQTDSDEDFGAATKIGQAPDMASLLKQTREAAPAAAPLPPPVPPPPPSARNAGPLPPPNPPPSAPGRPPIPRAFKSTQLGMGAPNVAPPPSPAQQGGPRAGFAPPPTSISTNPPPRDPDDVRTVMHSVDSQELLKNVVGGPSGPPAFAPQHRPAFPPQRPVAPPPPAADADDDDDGGRTVMREAPSDYSAGPPKAPPPPSAQQWQPAPPPAAGFQPQTQTDRPAPETSSTQALGNNALGNSALGNLGVASMIQETIQAMGGPNPPQPMDAPPNFPSPFEPTGGFGNAAPLLPNPNAPAGPFQPLGNAPAGPFAPMQNAPGGGGPFTPSGGQPAFDQSLPTFDPGPAGMPQNQALPPGAAPMMEAAASGPQPKKRSLVGLLVVCVLVLILAAASTFLALKFRAQIGF